MQTVNRGSVAKSGWEPVDRAASLHKLACGIRKSWLLSLNHKIYVEDPPPLLHLGSSGSRISHPGQSFWPKDVPKTDKTSGTSLSWNISMADFSPCLPTPFSKKSKSSLANLKLHTQPKKVQNPSHKQNKTYPLTKTWQQHRALQRSQNSIWWT